MDLRAVLKAGWVNRHNWWPVHKAPTLTQIHHLTGIQTSVNSQILPLHLCTHNIPFFLFPSLFSTSFAPETQKLGKERVFWDQTIYFTAKLSINCGRLPVWLALPRPSWPGLAPHWPQIHPAEGNGPHRKQLWSYHSQANGVISANCPERKKLTNVKENKSNKG